MFLVLELVALLLAATRLPGPLGTAAPAASFVRAREVALEALGEAALAVYDPADPVIFYDPRVLDGLGPELSAFVFAHEYGHIALRHRVGAGWPALLASGLIGSERARALELEADCYAAAVLERIDPDAVAAALRHFARQGDRRPDARHPTGSQRVRVLEGCLADSRHPSGGERPGLYSAPWDYRDGSGRR